MKFVSTFSTKLCQFLWKCVPSPIKLYSTKTFLFLFLVCIHISYSRPYLQGIWRLQPMLNHLYTFLKIQCFLFVWLWLWKLELTMFFLVREKLFYERERNWATGRFHLNIKGYEKNKKEFYKKINNLYFIGDDNL